MKVNHRGQTRVVPFIPSAASKRHVGLRFAAGAAIFLVLIMATVLGVDSQYVFFAGYVVLQGIVLATGWNILGGYAGYINFGGAGYFAVGAYTSAALYQTLGLPLPVLIAAGAAVGALLGLATGAISLRLKGIYFSIATLAVAGILETVVTNWNFIGGARGLALMTPQPPPPFNTYNQWLFFVMAVMVVAAISIARYIERSWIGRGLRALRDDEMASECAGVPTLKLKVFAACVSGAVMAAAGTPFALYMSFIEPNSAFSLNYALSAIAMPIIGGTSYWIGPVIGAVLLGMAQQIMSVKLPGEWSVLIMGTVLMVFVIAAPNGVVGLVATLRTKRNRGDK